MPYIVNYAQYSVGSGVYVRVTLVDAQYCSLFPEEISFCKKFYIKI